jgi:alanyl-tRNA synthetase
MGYENKYLKMAHRLRDKYGCSVIVAANPYDDMSHLEQDRAAVAGVLKTPVNLIATRASQLMAEIKELSAKVEALESKIAASKTDDLIKNAQRLGSVNVITAKIDNANTDSLRAIGDMLRDKDSSVVCVLASVADGKISFAAACGKDAVAAGAHAGNLLKTAAKICGGGGGGRPDSATAGGKDASKLDEALQSVYTTLKDSLK